MIYLYTDGASTGGKGLDVGGYAYIISHNGEVIHAGYGSSKKTTNNLMELEGAIQGLLHLKEFPIEDKEGITLVSDSRYTLHIADGTYSPKKNLDSATHLRRLAKELSIKGLWVRGHNGNEMNELADSLAGLGKREANNGKK
jgi:ribonuclease HI